MKSMKSMKSMNLIKVGIISLSLLTGVNSAFAASAPSHFTTRNFTPYESNAKVKGIFSPFPTPAGTPDSPKERAVSWGGLRVICGLFSSSCDAEIYMKTDTNNPIFVGKGVMNLKTGTIEPNRFVSNGFVLTSNEPGLIEIREDK